MSMNLELTKIPYLEIECIPQETYWICGPPQLVCGKLHTIIHFKVGTFPSCDYGNCDYEDVPSCWFVDQKRCLHCTSLLKRKYLGFALSDGYCFHNGDKCCNQKTLG